MLAALLKGETESNLSGERPSLTLHLLGVAYDFAQFYSFAIFPLLGWGKIPAMGWLLGLFRFKNPFAIVVAISGVVAPAATAVAWLVLATFVACVALTVRGFATGKFDSVLPLRIVRATADYVVILQITLVERMASILTCGTVLPGFWSFTSISCNGVVYALMLLSTVIIIVLFLLFSVVVAAVSFNRDYRAAGTVYSRRALGRVETVMMMLRTILTLLFTNSSLVPISILLSSSVVAGIVYAFLYLRFLPELDSWRNKLLCCLGVVFCYTSLCSIPAVMLPEQSASSWRPLLAVVFYVGLPGSVALAYIAVTMRLAAAAADPASSHAMALTTPNDVELVARLQVSSVIAQAQPPRVSPSSSASASTPDIDLALARAAAVLQRGSSKVFPESALMDCLHANFVRGHPRMCEVVDYAPFLAEVFEMRKKALGGFRRLSLSNRGSLVSDEEVAESFFTGRTLPLAATTPFPPATEVEIFLLNSGLAKNSAVDVRFLLSQARQAAVVARFEAAERASTALRGEFRIERTRLSAVQAVQKQQLVDEASVLTVRAMAAQLRLLNAAAMHEASGSGGARVGASSLISLSLRLKELSAANVGALGALSYLRSLAPGSSAVLFAQGNYLLGIVGDVRGAAVIYSKGEAIFAEEQKSARLEDNADEDAMGGDEDGGGGFDGVGVVLNSVAVRSAFARAESFHAGEAVGAAVSNLPPLSVTLKDALRAVILDASKVAGQSTGARTALSTRVPSPFPARGAKVPRESFYAPLRARARGILLLTTLAYAAAVIVTQLSAAAAGAATREVIASGDRHVLMARISRTVVRGAAITAGALRPDGFFSFNSTLTVLAPLSSALKSVHGALFTSARASTLAGEATFYTSQDAISLRALTAAGSEVSYSSSFGDAVLQFAVSAAALAPLGTTPMAASNLSLAGGPAEAFFIVHNMDGALESAATRATTFAIDRGAATNAAAATSVVIALLAAVIAPLLLGLCALLPPVFSARAEVERGLFGICALAPETLEEERAHADRCFSKILTMGALNDERVLVRVLREQAGLSEAGVREIVARAKAARDGADEGGEEDDRDGSGVATLVTSATTERRGRRSATACAPLPPHVSLLSLFVAPFALLLVFSAACLGYSLRELSSAASAVTIISSFGTLRAALIPLTAAVVSAETNGLSDNLRRAPISSAPIACNVSALGAAAASASAAATRIERLLDDVTTLSATYSDFMTRLLLEGACGAVVNEDGNFVEQRGGSATQLGLPPLECSGGVPAGSPTTGALFGSAGNGLIGIIRAFASGHVDLLKRRVEALATGAPLESASFMLAGATVVIAPARTSRNESWPCLPPLLDAPGRTWMLDAGQAQVVEPIIRLAQSRVYADYGGGLQALAVSQFVTAAFSPLFGCMLYYAFVLQGLNQLDDQLKLVKWLNARVQTD
jgi:hypothetical protein